MSDISISIISSFHISGERFSPKKAQKKIGLVFNEANEVGSIETLGPNKGKPRMYGSAVLNAPKDLELESNCYLGIEWIVDNLEDKINRLINCGADDMYLDIGVFYKNQCNMAFEPELLKKIANLNVAFWISCYEDYESEDN